MTKAKKNEALSLDFRSKKEMPAWVREVIEEHLSIEAQDAKSAGALGFMSRALVIATMPYKDPKTDAFTRVNGDFRLRIVAGSEKGIPYGIYPRLLTSWVTTEAVRKGEREIELGDSLSVFLRDVLDLKSTGGGKRGSASRVTDQMQRLFGSLITAQFTGNSERKGFSLRNVMIADELDLEDGGLWTPQAEEEAGQWKSRVLLTENFFRECVTNPVPIDLRAYKALRGSPLAMDVYTWLTYRMSYIEGRSRPIRWESLMMQFGSGFASDQAVRDFKKAFIRALKVVSIVYPQARLEVNEKGIVLLPSPTHIPKQTALF